MKEHYLICVAVTLAQSKAISIRISSNYQWKYKTCFVRRPRPPNNIENSPSHCQISWPWTCCKLRPIYLVMIYVSKKLAITTDSHNFAISYKVREKCTFCMHFWTQLQSFYSSREHALHWLHIMCFQSTNEAYWCMIFVHKQSSRWDTYITMGGFWLKCLVSLHV